MVDNSQTPIDQIADKYEQMIQRQMTENMEAGFMLGGLELIMKKAGMLGEDKIHMAMVPDFSGKGERASFYRFLELCAEHCV